jgi:uncharacterized protein (UPF0335 family)
MSDIAADQLRAIVERIERIEEDVKALNADKSEIYKEAKGTGFDPKIIRLLVAERRKDESELSETESLLELYRDALAGVHAHTRAA